MEIKMTSNLWWFQISKFQINQQFCNSHAITWSNYLNTNVHRPPEIKTDMHKNARQTSFTNLEKTSLIENEVRSGIGKALGISHKIDKTPDLSYYRQWNMLITYSQGLYCTCQMIDPPREPGLKVNRSNATDNMVLHWTGIPLRINEELSAIRVIIISWKKIILSIGSVNLFYFFTDIHMSSFE